MKAQRHRRACLRPTCCVALGQPWSCPRRHKEGERGRAWLSLRSPCGPGALGKPRRAFRGGRGSSHDLQVISGKLHPLEPQVPSVNPGPSTGHLRIVGSVLCKQNSAWGLTRSPQGGEGEREGHQAHGA